MIALDSVCKLNVLGVTGCRRHPPQGFFENWYSFSRSVWLIGNRPAETDISVSSTSVSKPRRDIHLVEIKYCEGTRHQNQLNAAKEQHKDLCNILQGASVTHHPMRWKESF